MDLSHHLLLDLYGSVECEARWTPMLDQLCNVMGMRSAVAQIFDDELETGHAQWTVRDTSSLALAAIHDSCVNKPDNPRLIFHTTTWVDTEISSDQRLFGASNPLLGVLRQRLRQVDLGDAIWATFPISNRRHFTLVLHRSTDDARDLEQSEEQFLNILLPHLKQSVQLNRGFSELETRSNHFEAALDKVRTGLILCGADLDVDWYNRAAGKMIETSTTLSLVHGQLWCGSPAVSSRLRTLAAAVARGDQPSATLALGDNADDLVHIRITRIDPAQTDRAWRADAQIALFLSHSADVPHFDAADVASLFSLTPAEARLAGAIAAGETLADFAERRGISLGTARIQLKQVLAKTASGRQAELVRKLCSSAVASLTQA